MKIIHVDYGVANRFDGYIEINKHLKKYPKLYDSILKHELSHTDKPFSLHDLKLDFTNSKVNFFDMLKFMFSYPKSFYQLLPVYKTKRGYFLDYNLIIMYLIFLSIFILTIYFGGKYL